MKKLIVCAALVLVVVVALAGYTYPNRYATHYIIWSGGDTNTTRADSFAASVGLVGRLIAASGGLDSGLIKAGYLIDLALAGDTVTVLVDSTGLAALFATKFGHNDLADTSHLLYARKVVSDSFAAKHGFMHFFSSQGAGTFNKLDSMRFYSANVAFSDSVFANGFRGGLNGNAGTASSAALLQGKDTAAIKAWGNPYGTVIYWYGDSTLWPSGYKLCNGTLKYYTSATDSFTTPDLRNVFAVGASGDSSGTPTSTISTAEASAGGTTAYTPAGSIGGVSASLTAAVLGGPGVVSMAASDHTHPAPTFTGLGTTIIPPYHALWPLIRSYP